MTNRVDRSTRVPIAVSLRPMIRSARNHFPATTGASPVGNPDRTPAQNRSRTGLGTLPETLTTTTD